MKKTFLMLAISLWATTAAAEPAKEQACPEQKEYCSDKKESLRDKLPPLKTGFLVDLDPEGRDGFFYFGLELHSWEFKNKQRLSFDAGVASSRVLLGLSWGAFFDGNVGPFLWTGYNISENAPAWGLGINMLKL